MRDRTPDALCVEEEPVFARVLVPLDGSTLAVGVLAHVAALAQADADMVLLRVIEPLESGEAVDPLEWRLRRDVAQAYLDQVALDWREHTSLQLRTMVLEGDPAEKILETARETDAQLVALSSHGAGGLNAWNLNSVAFKVAQRAGTSILVVRSYRINESDIGAVAEEERYRRILVPLDGSLRSEHVLPAADRLACRQGATVLLAHVVMHPRSIQRLGAAGTSDLQDRALVKGTMQAQRYLDELAKGIAAHTEVHVLLNHDPAAALHQLVDDSDVDLVIISAHGHSGERTWPHGSLATSFVLHGGTALLVLQDVAWEALDPSKAELAARCAPATVVHAGAAPSEGSERINSHGIA